MCSMLDDSERHILQLEEEGPSLARSFTFYQEMRGYVTDLVECLDEKVGRHNQYWFPIGWGCTPCMELALFLSCRYFCSLISVVLYVLVTPITAIIIFF